MLQEGREEFFVKTKFSKLTKADIPAIKISKKDFKLREDIIFLNHGSYGACPKAVLEEQRRWIDSLEE
jgi:DNA polymerase sigma